MGLFDGAVNKIGGLFGLGGGQGEYYKADQLKSAGQDALKGDVEAQNSSKVKDLIGQLQAGKISLAEAMGQTGNAAEQSALATSPIGVNAVASDQVRNDPLTKGMLGEGGSLSQALGQEKDLANRGYSLQPEDHEAYGQASGNIARQFGQSEQGLGEALAARGMSAGGSGNAMAQFTGLQGNKNEQLGQMQRQIADQRMSKNLERLTATRNYINQMGNLGQTALSGAAGRNMDAGQLRMNEANSLAGNETSAFNAQQNANQASMASKLANKEKSLGDALSSGIMSGVAGGGGALIGGGIGGIGGEDSKKAGATSGSGGKPDLVGTAAKAAPLLMMSDRNVKTDIKETDASVFLDALVPYSYKYKNEKHGKGLQLGIMAQDLEKSVPEAVTETDEGKAVDVVKVIGPIMAALASINKRLKIIEGKK